jgi:uncharacterized protein (TIGR02231 family)
VAAHRAATDAEHAWVDANDVNRGAQDKPQRNVTLRCQWPAQSEVSALVVTYTVPCAAWRPRHEARLRRRGDVTEVAWSTQAQVWQATGESWRGRGELSTARQKTTTLPTLHADILHLMAKQQPARQVIVASRQEDIAHHRDNRSQPGVDDGGEARQFAVQQLVVPSNGRAHRVQLHESVMAASFQWMCIPEQVLAVQAIATLSHEGTQPLLAGPVLTHLGQQCTGTTMMPLVTSGQTFTLSFGSDDGFEVGFARSVVVQDRVLQSSVRHYVQTATVASRCADVRTITVCLRVPVSEVDRLKVLPSPQHSTVEWRADAQGMVRLVLELAPGERKSVAIAFALEAPSDVVVPNLW